MPELSVFQIIEVLLIIIVMIYLIRFFWTMFIDKQNQPVNWKLLVKEGKIPAELLRMSKTYHDKTRFFNLWLQVERIKRSGIPGVYAELGVYKGETARIIHLCEPSRKFYLFDTFKGFTEGDLHREEGEANTYTSRNFADTTIEKVKRYVSGNDNIVYVPGYFPETIIGLEEEQYAFVHIDADLYNPIKAGLEYFYPRLSAGGIIIIHDYNDKWRGAMQAVDEFLETIPEQLIPIPDMDNSVMILKCK